VAAAVGRKAKSWGLKPFLAIACVALIARGIIFGAVSPTSPIGSIVTG
jgi:hypothetical protein